MKSQHKFHKGFDLKLPERTARKGFVLGKLIAKEKKKKPKKFKPSSDALDHVRAKSTTRHKIKKKDYLKITCIQLRTSPE